MDNNVLPVAPIGMPAPASSPITGNPAPGPAPNASANASASPAPQGAGPDITGKGAAPGTPPAAQPAASPASLPADSAQANAQANAPANANAPNAAADPANSQANPASADPEHSPIEDWSKVDLGLGNAQVDAAMLEGYGKLAKEIRLTPAQAKALAQWQLEAAKECSDAMLREQGALLAKSWGRDMERNRGKVVALCSRLDRMPGLENFSAELARSGGANNAVVAQGLLALANMLSEDSVGTAQGASAARPETAYEGIVDAFARARGQGA